ncbi:MAG: hypothetical protein MUC48_14830 [Leptolyngbya sp. Prado105]|nr:hypothetical protein [Leptolyngbya sp. Prado105]
MARTYANAASRFKWILISASLVGLTVYGIGWLQSRKFNSGMQAYESGQCDQAIADFNEFIGDRKPSSDETDQVAKAIAKRQECQNYSSILATANRPAEMLSNASQFIQLYPNSPLVQPLRRSLNLKTDQVKSWASPSVCQKLDFIEKAALIPQRDQTLPLLYQQCGNLLVSLNQVPQGVAIYEQFLNKFTNHPAREDVKKTYAAALVKDAKATGSGTISAPGQVGVTGDGSTQVTIQNDSQEAMRIVFSGATPRVEELPPCKDCQSFNESNVPAACPEKGSIGTYVLNPGDYDVLVKSYGGRTVRPFTGRWGLNSGVAYRHCFYIVQTDRATP